MDKPNEPNDSHPSNSILLFKIYYATPTIFKISFLAHAHAHNLEEAILVKILLTISLKSFIFLKHCNKSQTI